MTKLDRLVNGSCGETRDCLSAHLDGDLLGLRRRRVLRHLSRCERCRAVLDSLRSVVEKLRSLGTLEPERLPSVANAVVSRVRHDVRA